MFGLAALAGPAWSQRPDQPIRLMVPFVAGSVVDVVARALGEAMSRRMGQPVLVENRPGANAQIGSEAVARSAADGLTLMLGTMDSHALNPLVYGKLRYDPVKDFAPIGLVGTQSLVLVGANGAPFRNGAELIAEARKAPGRFNFGTWGLGSVAHVWMAMLERSAGVELNHIPFQGTPAALNALMGNQIDLMFLPPLLALSNQQAGKLRIIGSTAARRASAFPDIPTLAEQGFAGYEGTTWFALFAPAGIGADVQSRLNRELNAALKQPEVMDKLNGFSMLPTGGEPATLTRTMADSRAALGRAIIERKIQLLD